MQSSTPTTPTQASIVSEAQPEVVNANAAETPEATTHSAAIATIDVQHAFLDAAKMFNWDKVMQMVGLHPELIHAQPCNRRAALHQAACQPNLTTVQRLLCLRAVPAVVTSAGQTPSDLAGMDNAAIQTCAGDAQTRQLIRDMLRVPSGSEQPPTQFVQGTCPKQESFVDGICQQPCQSVGRGDGESRAVGKQGGA